MWPATNNMYAHTRNLKRKIILVKLVDLGTELKLIAELKLMDIEQLLDDYTDVFGIHGVFSF